MTTQIVLTVQGGLVSDAYSNDPSVQIVVVDFDTDGAEEGSTYPVGDDEAYVTVLSTDALSDMDASLAAAVKAAC